MKIGFATLGQHENERHVRYLHFLHDSLFSLNIALVVRLANAQTSLFSLEPNLQFRINGAFGLNPHSNVGGYSAFFLVAVSLALGILALLWVFSRARFVGEAILSVSGTVSLVALPVGWLYVTHISPVLPGLPNPPRAALLLELAAVIVCSVLYLLARRSYPIWSAVLVLVLHFALWGWLLLGGWDFWLAPIKLVFPFVGFCSCLAWGGYVALRRPTFLPSVAV